MKFYVGMPHSGETKVLQQFKEANIKIDFMKKPSLEKECVQWYNREILDEELIGKLVRSRSNTINEIAPHFMLITKIIKEVFPLAQIVALKKEPNDYINRRCFPGIFERLDLFEDENFKLIHNALYEFMLDQTPEVEILET